ncbi:MAG: hypothetical protein ABS46_11000 [Cytophagaceae bacterium SCN 52-12]|nr:MAG: hypothetical protein ABS46_11000 [Cytophagaceae bacterium SCN 52-12]
MWILVLLLSNHSISGQNLNKQGFCRVKHDEHAAKSFVETIRTPKGTSCDAYYLNVYFHFIRDNAGGAGQLVGNIGQYMNILNNAFNAHNIHFISLGYDEINNSTLADPDYDISAGFSSLTMNHRSDAINIYLFRSDKPQALSVGVATGPVREWL